nr:hypothetical protein CFP56_26839 [Quercus suber]POE81873.1 hypothetical protein CFP56_08199 [Quercus suber]
MLLVLGVKTRGVQTITEADNTDGHRPSCTAIGTDRRSSDASAVRTSETQIPHRVEPNRIDTNREKYFQFRSGVRRRLVLVVTGSFVLLSGGGGLLGGYGCDAAVGLDSGALCGVGFVV